MGISSRQYERQMWSGLSVAQYQFLFDKKHGKEWNNTE